MTIYDIAREAKTSISTVSRYLNHKNVREDAKKRIQEVIEKYHYRPNQIAQGLVLKSMKTIAIMLVDIRIPHYARMAFTMEREFTKIGYNVIICNTSGDMRECARYLDTLSNKNIDGIAFIGSIFHQINNDVNLLNKLRNIPVVTQNFELSLPVSQSIYIDDELGMRQALTYLIDKKRRNIYFVLDTNTLSANKKKNVFINYCNKQQKNPDDFLVVAKRSPKGGEEAFQELILNCKVDAVIFEEEITALGALRYCNRHGIQLGVELDIIGFNHNEYTEAAFPSLTCVDTRVEEQAIIIVQFLEKMIQKESASTPIIISPKLIIKETA